MYQPKKERGFGIKPVGVETTTVYPDHLTTFVPTPPWEYPRTATVGNLAKTFAYSINTAAVKGNGQVTISDAPEGNQRARWNSFENYKVSNSTRPVAFVRVRDGRWANLPYFHSGFVSDSYYGLVSYTGFGEKGRFATGLPSYYTVRPDGGFVPAPANLDSLLQRGLDSILPTVKAELSLPNFIYELKDITSIRGTLFEIKRFGQLLTPLLRNNAKVLGTQGLKTLRQILRLGSNVYLQKEFNVAPLLSDISNLRIALLGVDKRMAAFIARAGRPQNRHFAYNWFEHNNETTISPQLSTGSTQGARVLVATRYCVPEATRFHVQVRYNYNYTAFQLAHAQLLGMLDRLGVNLNPTIIWNAIPWSFVVDWVAGIGRWLDQFKFQNMTPTINILRALWSVSRRRIIRVERKFSQHDGLTYTFGESAPCPVVDESAYRRTVFNIGHSSIESSGLSPKEFSLGAALVLVQRKRPRR